jgi:hypothetical protein
MSRLYDGIHFIFGAYLYVTQNVTFTGRASSLQQDELSRDKVRFKPHMIFEICTASCTMPHRPHSLPSPYRLKSGATQARDSRVRSAVESGIRMGVRLAKNIATVKMGHRSSPLL